MENDLQNRGKQPARRHSAWTWFNRLGVAFALLAATLPMAGRAEWQVVAKRNAVFADVLLPDLSPGPAWEMDFAAIFLADATPGGEIHFHLERAGKVELWKSSAGKLSPYAALDTPAALGPGRAGAESGHVFRALYTSALDMGGDGATIFVGRAGPPAPNALSFASFGVWRAGPAGNVEIARARNYQAGQAASPLDPGLGDFRFVNAGSFVRNVWALPDGKVIFVANVLDGATGAPARGAVIRHTPGVGNEICAMHGSFLGQTLTLDAVFVDANQTIYVRSGNFGNGFWRVCAGALLPLAVENQTGSLGPALPSPTAYFPYPLVGLGQFATSSSGGFYFTSEVRDSTPGAWQGKGLFQQRNGANLPLALTGVQGAYGSGLVGMPFADIDQSFSPQVAGEQVLFGGEVTTDVQNVRGLWRVGADRVPVAIALEGTTDPRYAPAPGKVWQQLSALFATIFPNGDVVVKAATVPGNGESLWLLREGAAPEEILRVGDLIDVPTPNGPMTVPIGNFLSFPGTRRPGIDTRDTWADAHGNLVVWVSTSEFGNLLLRRRVSASDLIFADGFGE